MPIDHTTTDQRPPVYEEHAGTIRVSGSSRALVLAQCAQKLISGGAIDPIEFFYIGGNAGQQAMKAMTILSFQIARESSGTVEAVFKPMRVLTNTTDGEGVHEKDASVWRLVLIRH